MSHDATAQCGNCQHFRNDPAYLEAVFPGLTSLSSGYGSVRADDGVCQLHDRYLRASYSCADFSARACGGSRPVRSPGWR